MILSNRGRGSTRVLLSGGDVVMRDHVLSPGTVVLEDGVITEIALGSRPGRGALE